MEEKKPALVLMAEDDDDFYVLVREAFKKLGLVNEIRRVENGVELLDYLLNQGQYQDPSQTPMPGVILLDLNMPKKNGLEALEEIRAHENLKKIPVIMLTISRSKKDIILSYSLGANSFITKPYEFGKLEEALKTFHQYWFETVKLPEA